MQNGLGTQMETNRTVPPDTMVLILRDLLTIYDPALEPGKMSEISELESGIYEDTGEHIGAHREEILS